MYEFMCTQIKLTKVFKVVSQNLDIQTPGTVKPLESREISTDFKKCSSFFHLIYLALK